MWKYISSLFYEREKIALLLSILLNSLVMQCYNILVYMFVHVWKRLGASLRFHVTLINNKEQMSGSIFHKTLGLWGRVKTHLLFLISPAFGLMENLFWLILALHYFEIYQFQLVLSPSWLHHVKLLLINCTELMLSNTHATIFY